MNKKAQAFVIKLNSSEALAFSGLFGLFFAMPNFYQIFLEKIFPIIIQTSTINKELFQLLYILMLILVTCESIAWIIQLANNMQKTQHLNVDYNLYMVKIVVFGLLGIVAAIFLNKWLF
jgi:multisubunit Na+/H+ antiporter MnhB subunit